MPLKVIKQDTQSSQDDQPPRSPSPTSGAKQSPAAHGSPKGHPLKHLDTFGSFQMGATVEDVKWKQGRVKPLKMKGNDKLGSCMAGRPAAEK